MVVAKNGNFMTGMICCKNRGRRGKAESEKRNAEGKKQNAKRQLRKRQLLNIILTSPVSQNNPALRHQALRKTLARICG
jgi:hypothetical protein